MNVDEFEPVKVDDDGAVVKAINLDPEGEDVVLVFSRTTAQMFRGWLDSHFPDDEGIVDTAIELAGERFHEQHGRWPGQKDTEEWHTLYSKTLEEVRERYRGPLGEKHRAHNM